MKKFIAWFPLLIVSLTSCGTIQRMNELVNESTCAIHNNREMVEENTRTIRRNAEIINDSTRTIEENRRQLEAASRG